MYCDWFIYGTPRPLNLLTNHMICYRSQEASQSDDSMDKAAVITILGDDVSMLDDPLVNAMNVNHVGQQLEKLVSAAYNGVTLNA